jgi:hypothetical protein
MWVKAGGLQGKPNIRFPNQRFGQRPGLLGAVMTEAFAFLSWSKGRAKTPETPNFVLKSGGGLVSRLSKHRELGCLGGVLTAQSPKHPPQRPRFRAHHGVVQVFYFRLRAG